MRINDGLAVRWNLEIDLFDRGKRRRWHQRTHNIVVNSGRQFICESITPQALTPSSFIRHQDNVVRYVGFGIGGTRQTSGSASAPPYSNVYPLGYEYLGAPHNAQTDTDVTVSNLERPVSVTDFAAPSPTWLKQIAAPGTFPTATSTRFIAVFSQTDISFGGGFISVPLSEIGLYTSGANPGLPNGAAGAYPGAGTYLVAYDTFDTVHKTGLFSIEVRWELRL